MLRCLPRCAGTAGREGRPKGRLNNRDNESEIRREDTFDDGLPMVTDFQWSVHCRSRDRRGRTRADDVSTGAAVGGAGGTWLSGDVGVVRLTWSKTVKAGVASTLLAS